MENIVCVACKLLLRNNKHILSHVEINKAIIILYSPNDASNIIGATACFYDNYNKYNKSDATPTISEFDMAGVKLMKTTLANECKKYAVTRNMCSYIYLYGVIKKINDGNIKISISYTPLEKLIIVANIIASYSKKNIIKSLDIITACNILFPTNIIDLRINQLNPTYSHYKELIQNISCEQTILSTIGHYKPCDKDAVMICAHISTQIDKFTLISD